MLTYISPSELLGRAIAMKIFSYCKIFSCSQQETNKSARHGWLHFELPEMTLLFQK